MASFELVLVLIARPAATRIGKHRLYRRHPMAPNDAEYFRQRRRQQGVLPRDPRSAPRFLRHWAELRRLQQLPWPQNLLGEHATIAELMAEAALIEQGARISDELCPCGCRREHNLQAQMEPRESGESP